MVALPDDSSRVRGELQDARLLRQRARLHRVRRGHAGQGSSRTPPDQCKRHSKGKLPTLKSAYLHLSAVNASWTIYLLPNEDDLVDVRKQSTVDDLINLLPGHRSVFERSEDCGE